MLKLDLPRLKHDIRSCDGFQVRSRLQVVEEGLACALPAAIGDQCLIVDRNGREIAAEVIGFRRGLAQLAPYEFAEELRSGQLVLRLPERRSIPVGRGILGRIFDGIGRPIDGLGAITPSERRIVRNAPPSALQRERVHKPFITGQKAIDGLLLCGRTGESIFMASSNLLSIWTMVQNATGGAVNFFFA